MIKLNVHLSLEQFVDVKTAVNSRIVHLVGVLHGLDDDDELLSEFRRQIASLNRVLEILNYCERIDEND